MNCNKQNKVNLPSELVDSLRFYILFLLEGVVGEVQFKV